MDTFERYKEFVGATTVNQIPTVTFTFADPFYNEVSYTIGPATSLLLFTQSAFGITRSTYHNQEYAEQVDENGAISWDDSAHLKDLITVEALITGRIAFLPATTHSLGRVLVTVPGGWPVDLHIAGDGRLWIAVIHGAAEQHFYPQAYTTVGGVKIVTNWLLDKRQFHATSVASANSPIAPRQAFKSDWRWQPRGSRWTESFVPFGNRPMLPIWVNGIKSKCILDTGTAGLFLPPSLAANARVAQIGSAPVNGQANSSTASYGRVDIVVGPAELPSAVVVIGPSPPGGYAVCGYDFLASFLVHIAKRTVTISTRPAKVPPCSAYCVRVDNWLRTAVARVRVGALAADRATLDTGREGSVVVASNLRPSNDTGADCDAQAFVSEPLTIGPVVFGPTAACYTSLNASHQVVVGSAVLLHRDLTLDLGDGEVWLRPSGV